MSKVLLDSAYWIALRSEKEVHHQAARKITLWLARERIEVVVTPYIFAEVYAFFSRMKLIRQQIIGDFWNNPTARIEQPTVPDQHQALEILKAHRDKSFSFCDALSFAVMLRMNVHRAVSFDDHFRQFGMFEIIDGTSL